MMIAWYMLSRAGLMSPTVSPLKTFGATPRMLGAGSEDWASRF